MTDPITNPLTQPVKLQKLASLHQNLYQRLHNTSKYRLLHHQNLVIMNFDNAYIEQDFYQSMKHQWIDCTKISGTNGYCDEEAKKILRTRIMPYPISGIHYIDSGNYHYVSELWLEKATEDFVLVVFDHHTDMQPSLFEQLLSCGCWVKNVLDTNPYVKKVFLIGAKEQLIEQIPGEYRERVICYAEHRIDHNDSWQKYVDQYQQTPVYISIDKDVLSVQDAATNWDQGSMTLEELAACLHHILEKHEILGVDICGEYTIQNNYLQNEAGNQKNNLANEEILDTILLDGRV